MNLTSGYPYWLVNSGIPFDYPKLNKSIKTDIVIIGGGISGALSAYYLTKAGLNCVLIDSRTIGLGSTCASTALLQYELDKPLCELTELIGYQSASRAYQMCSESIDILEDISKDLDFKYFEKHESMYYAAYKKDINFLKKEYEIRKKSGFKLDLIDAETIKKDFGFHSEAAILSQQGATTDAYLFTHALLQKSIQEGLIVYDRTTINNIDYKPKGVSITTDEGFMVNANKIVNASGYEITEFINKKILILNSTYALASEHIETPNPVWKSKTLLWNTADPYLYMRLTHDNRIILGGRDEPFYNPKKRDQLIKSKTQKLVKDFAKLFPEINLIPEFSWTGTFGSTKDALPYIGTYDKTPHTYYALGFGGNGITFSVIAAQIITDMILGKKNKDANIFAFDRP